MNKDTLFKETVDGLIDSLTTYNRKITDIGVKDTDITATSPEILKKYLLKIFTVLEKNGESSINYNSAYHLGWVMANAERYLATKGDFDTSVPFMEFLRSTLFKCHLCNNTLGYHLEKGLYAGSGIKNDIVKKSIDFNNIYKGTPKNYYGIQFDVDCIYITYRYGRFMLKMEEQAGYANGEETDRLKNICADFEEFLTIIDRKDKADERRAQKLLKKTRTEWPALAYSVAEITYMFDERLSIAQGFMQYPKITPMRSKESRGHEKNKSRKKTIRNLILLVAVCAILAVIIGKIYVFFSGHPERQGWAMLIALFGLIFTYFMSFPLVGLLFWGQSKANKLGL